METAKQNGPMGNIERFDEMHKSFGLSQRPESKFMS
jgi:hypothetical protein